MKTSKLTNLLASLAALALVFTSSRASAATATWNGGATPVGLWSDALNWGGIAVNPTGDDLVFAGSAQPANTNDLVTAANSVTLNPGASFEMRGSALTLSAGLTNSAMSNSWIIATALAAGQNFSAAPGTTVKLGGVISGAQTLGYLGGGNFVIDANNSASGNVTIDGSTVRVNSGRTLFCAGFGFGGVRSAIIQNGGTLIAPNFANGTGNFWGAPSDGANNVIYATGGGTFRMMNAVMAANVNKGITVNSGVTARFEIPTGTICTWFGLNSSRDFNMDSGATLVFGGGGNFTTSRAIRGAGSIEKTDGGILEVRTNSMTHFGATILTSGILALTNNASIDNSSNILIAAGATFDVSSFTSYTLAAGRLTASGTGTTVGTTAANITGGTTVDLGSKPITLNYNGSNPALYISTGALVLNNNTVTVDGSVLGVGSYTIATAAGGTVTLSGTTTVNGSAIGGGTEGILSASGGNLILTIALVTDEVWTGKHSSEWSTATLPSPKNWSVNEGGPEVDFVNGDEAVFSDSASNFVVNISVANVAPEEVTFSAAANAYTLNGPFGITGNATLGLTGAGTVTIANTNSFTGAVTIGGGGTLVANSILNKGVASALGAGTNVLLNGGTLSLTGGSTSSDRNITVAGASTIGVTNAATTLTLTGPMAASDSLSKTGAGSLVLAGSGAHMFGTFSGGTNQFGNGGTAGTISGNFVNNAPFVFNHANGVTVGGIISGTGSVTKTGTGTLTLGAINTFSGNLTISNGTVNAAIVTTGGFASPLGEGYNTVTINTGALLTFTVGDRGCYHHGPININAGTVNFTGYDNSLGANPITFDTAPGFITGGGTLRLREAGVKIVVTAAASGSSISMGQLTLHDNLSIPFEVADGAAAVDLAISSVIKHAESGSGISKQGNGVMTMTVGGTYGGQTTVAAGKLGLSGGLNSPVLVNSGATLFRGTANVGTMGITNSLTLNAGSTIFLKLNKTGGVLTSDTVQGLSSVTCNGTLIVTNITSDATLLALGDTVQLFSIGGTGFATYALPALPPGLTWDVSGLTASGSITVVAGTPVTTAPTFNPSAGSYYQEALMVTISSLNPPGATIYYTTDGSTPTLASPSGITPVVVPVPNNTNLTIQAFAQAPSSTASSIVSATYDTIIPGDIALVMASTPTGFWPLSEPAAPTAYDLSTNELNGTYSGGGVTYGVTGLPVGSNTVVTMDGVEGVVTIPYSATLNPSGPFTAEGWFNPATVEASFDVVMSSYNHNGGGPKSGWALNVDTSGWFFSIYNGGGGAAFLLYGGTPTVGQWDHVASVWDGTNGYLYVNGVLANTSAATTYVANGLWPFTIGVRSDGTRAFPGSVGNVAFYDRALTAEEIQTHALNSPLLNISQSGTDVVVSWVPGGGGLQAAPAVTGVYTNVPGATSPLTNVPTGGSRFYRLKY